jgi:hypothetical protein
MSLAAALASIIGVAFLVTTLVVLAERSLRSPRGAKLRRGSEERRATSRIATRFTWWGGNPS